MPEPDTTPPPDTGRTALRAARTLLVGYWLVLATLTHWPSLSTVQPPPLAPDDPRVLLQLDKPIHMAAFGGLTLLLVLARPLGPGRSAAANRLAAGAIALGYAVLDETTQGFFADRTVSHSDLLANFLGVTGVTLLALTPARAAPDAAANTPRPWLPLLAGPALLLVGGALLAITQTVNRETAALHFFAAAAVTLALLRKPPAVPGRPRLSNLLICMGVLLVVILGEVAQGFAGMMFSRSEVFFGGAGVALIMAGWSLRLALAEEPVPAVAKP